MMRTIIKLPLLKQIGIVLVLLFQSIQIQGQQVKWFNSSNDANSTLIQRKVEKLIRDINEFQKNGTDRFDLDAGIQKLKKRVESQNLFAPDLKSVLTTITDNDKLRIGGLFLQEINKSAFDWVEIQLVLNKKNVVQDVVFIDEKLSVEQILAYGIKPKRSEVDTLITQIEKYMKSVQQKDKVEFSQFYSNVQSMMVSSIELRKGENESVFMISPQSRIQEIMEKEFSRNNEVEVRFQLAQFFKHPSIQGIYGFTAKQEWLSSIGSFEEYVFMILDMNSEKMKVLHYQSQKYPFESGTLKSLENSLLYMNAGLISVSNDTLTDWPRHRVVFSVKSSDETVFSVNKLKSFFEEGIAFFNGIDVQKDSIEIRGDILIVPYQILQTYPVSQHYSQAFTISKMKGIKGFEQQLSIFVGKDTYVEINADKLIEALPSYPEKKWLQEISFKSKPNKTKIVVADVHNFPVAELVSEDSLKSVELMDGDYTFYAYKEGFYPKKIHFHVNENANRMVAVRLHPVESTISKVNAKPVQSNYVKTKWKVIGAAAILAGITYWYIQSESTDRPRIPNPPGRPIGVPEN